MSVQLLNRKARQRCAILAITLVAPGFWAGLRADPYASAWSIGQKSAARLIAASSADSGSLGAGVEIRLDPDALTYWRNPGAAGAPPVFDFEDSKNIKNVRVLYPTPVRIEEAGLDAFGYRGGVTFPIELERADASRPAVLALSLEYAVCSQICLPVKAKAALALPASPRAKDAAQAEPSPEDAALKAARAQVPLRLNTQQRDAKIAIERDDRAADPTWRLTVKAEPDAAQAAVPGAGSAAPDLFVEAPPGWYFESKKGDGPNEFVIVEVEAPSTASGGKIALTATLAQPRQSFEFGLELDAGSRP